MIFHWGAVHIPTTIVFDPSGFWYAHGRRFFRRDPAEVLRDIDSMYGVSGDGWFFGVIRHSIPQKQAMGEYIGFQPDYKMKDLLDTVAAD